MHHSIVEYIWSYAQETPNKLCIADSFRELTYREYWDLILRFHHCFVKRKICPGDCIVVEAAQSITYLALQSAIQLARAIFVPLERGVLPERLLEVAKLTDAAMVISNKTTELPFPVITYDSLETELMDLTPSAEYTFPESGDTAEILFSSGTTGKSKGVELTHKNNVALAENVKYGVEMGPDNVELLTPPANHSHCLRRYYGNMFNGSSVVIIDGVMDLDLFFTLIEKYHVTGIDMVPAALNVVLRLSRNKLSEYRDQLDYIQLGSAPLSEENKERLCELLPDTRLYNFYGSTESGCTCILDFNAHRGMENCIGKATHNAKFYFVDEDWKEKNATKDNPGLLACSGAMNMKGYWKNPEETGRIMKDGLIFSSDLGYEDEDGYIFMLGRSDDVINIGGLKVSPLEVEEAAAAYPDIEDCICVPVKDRVSGQSMKLCVVLRENAAFDVMSIKGFLRTKLEAYKVPAKIERIDAVPRTYNGKIDRKKLL